METFIPEFSIPNAQCGTSNSQQEEQQQRPGFNATAFDGSSFLTMWDTTTQGGIAEFVRNWHEEDGSLTKQDMHNAISWRSECL